MRRILSIAVLLLLALPGFAPLFALANPSAAESNLAACCRRLGEHHCAMSPGERADFLRTANRIAAAPEAPCPFRTFAAAPATVAPFTPALVFMGTLPQAFAHPHGSTQAGARRRVARERARYKRGPPLSA